MTRRKNLCRYESLPAAGIKPSKNRNYFAATWALLIVMTLSVSVSPLAQAKVAEAAAVVPPGLTRCVKTTCAPIQQAFGTKLVPLHGLELFEYWGFKLYTAALYAPEGVDTSAEVLADIPKSLILHYHRKIRNDQIIKAAEHNLQKNPANDMASLRPAIDQLHAAFVTVQKGDTYELRYEPGIGTTLLFNGQPKVTVPGVDFQRAYFGVWLSDYPLNSKLRDKLLNT